MSATVAETLEKAAEIIAKGWTQGVFARDREGRNVAYGSTRAACFCPAGAIYRVVGVGSAMPVFDALLPWVRKRGFPHVAAWNDAEGRTQSEVVAALKAAAERARAGE